MKTFYKPFLILFFAVFSFTISVFANGNTEQESINLTDANGYRQGFWIIKGAISVEEGYKNDQVVEEGNYIDNKREGIWKKYYENGKLKSEITYSHNLPNGAYKLYYPNGILEETSIWTGNKNKGSFKRYHQNGKIAQDFTFLDNGKRKCEQKYYYENGNLQMTVEVENGTAQGWMKRFFPDGELKEEKFLNEGTVDESTIKTFKAKTAINYTEEFPEIPKKETTVNKTDKPNLSVFKATGYNTLYNSNHQVTQVGEFIKGRLSDGKWLRYDENGLLKKIEIYKGGKFIGYGVIEDEDK